MWYVLILYFVSMFFRNIFIKDYDENDDSEVEIFKDTFYPILGIALSAILGLFF